MARQHQSAALKHEYPEMVEKMGPLADVVSLLFYLDP